MDLSIWYCTCLKCYGMLYIIAWASCRNIKIYYKISYYPSMESVGHAIELRTSMITWEYTSILVVQSIAYNAKMYMISNK